MQCGVLLKHDVFQLTVFDQRPRLGGVCQRPLELVVEEFNASGTRPDELEVVLRVHHDGEVVLSTATTNGDNDK